MLNSKNTNVQSNQLSALNFSEIGKNLSFEFDKSNIRVQTGFWNSIKAKSTEAFAVNHARNRIGDLFHGNDTFQLSHKRHEDSKVVNLFTKLSAHFESEAKTPSIKEKNLLISDHNASLQLFFVKEDIEKLEDCAQVIKKLGKKHKYFKLAYNLKKYCDFIAKSKNCNTSVINRESGVFLSSILKQIPIFKKEEAQIYFEEMIQCSTHFLNDIDISSEDQKKLGNCYKEATESFINLLFDNLEGLPHKEKEIFKNILLISTFYAGQNYTYQKRKLGDKVRIRLKQAFVPCAYVFGAILGTLIGHYITTAIVAKAFLALSITVGTVFPIILISFIGLSSGYLLTKLIEKTIEICFNKAKYNINNNSVNTIKMKNEFIKSELLLSDKTKSNMDDNSATKVNYSIDRNNAKESVIFGKNIQYDQKMVDFFSDNVNNKSKIAVINEIDESEKIHVKIKIDSIRAKIIEYKESVDTFLHRTKTYISEFYINKSEKYTKFHILKDEILELFKILSHNDEELLNSLIFLFHEYINCPDGKSIESINSQNKQIEEKLKKIIPNYLSREDLILFLELPVILALKTRSITTASMRRSFALIYFISDVMTDFLGLQAAVYTNSLTNGLSEGYSLGAEFTANLLTGLLPLGAGITFYLGITTWATIRDKNEVNIPNNHCIEYVQKYLINQKKYITLSNQLAIEIKTVNNDLFPCEKESNNNQHFTGAVAEISNFLFQEKSKFSNKRNFLSFKALDWNKDNKIYTIHYEITPSLRDVSDGYLSYPLMQTRTEMLNIQKEIIQKNLDNLENELENQSKKQEMKNNADFNIVFNTQDLFGYIA